MRAELDAVRLDFPNRGEAEHLKAAAIRQNRPVPIDKAMQPAGSANDVHPWPDIKVISIAQNDLRAHFTQFPWINGFDASLCPHRHEHRRVHNAVRRGETTKSGFRGGV